MNTRLLFDLLDIPSPSGGEEPIKRFLTTHLAGIGIEVTDMGPAGLCWEIGSGGKLALFSTHIDQTCLIVRKIDEEGYIFLEMSGIDYRIVPSQEIRVLGKKELRGVIGLPAPHFTPVEVRKKPIEKKSLYLDVGLPADEVRELVPTGTLCTWDAKPAILGEVRISGPGLDNKVSVFLALLLTAELKDKSLPGRLRFYATCQEEGVMLGAGYAGRSAASSNHKPSFAVVVDATFGEDSDSEDETFRLGEGPVLGKGPILSRPHLQHLRKTASRLDISYNLEPLIRSTGTEADALSISGQGIPTVLVSVPLRYMHTPVEVVDTRDVEATFQLLSEALQDLGLWNF